MKTRTQTLDSHCVIRLIPPKRNDKLWATREQCLSDSSRPTLMHIHGCMRKHL